MTLFVYLFMVSSPQPVDSPRWGTLTVLFTTLSPVPRSLLGMRWTLSEYVWNLHNFLI